MKKYAEAFITIEYTLLILVIFSVYSFMLSICVFLYNQCILQSNTRILALESDEVSKVSDELQIRQLRKKEANLYNEKYLFVDQPVMKYKFKEGKCYISGEITLPNPLYFEDAGDEYWSIGSRCQTTRLSAVNVLRLCKKAIKLKNLISIRDSEVTGNE